MGRLLHQYPLRTRTAIHRRLEVLLHDPRLRKFRALVAYVRWEGLATLADPLEGFLSRGGKMETIYGVDNGVTTPDALIYSRYLRQLYPGYTFAGVYEWQYVDSIFHPKLFEFHLDNEVVVIVGSANLTGGGFLRNHELCVELRVKTVDELKELSAVWSTYRRKAATITPRLIRRLVESQRLSSERIPAETATSSPNLKTKRLGIRAPASRARPLFKRILRTFAPALLKHKILADAESLTEKPRRLYLQILHETGGGHQVQLPVATLGSFFGVGRGQSKPVSFDFGGELIKVSLTHFGNNTHRVRLRPLQSIARPSVLVFNRLNASRYRCKVVPKGQYKKTLARKCPEQTRVGSRRWGLDG